MSSPATSDPTPRAAGGRPPFAGSRAGLLIALAGVTIVSQFYRSSLAVIAPELIEQLRLTPQTLGFAGGMFFLALGVAQIPVGMSFDRFGPRRTVVALCVFAVAGTLTIAGATDGAQLVAGRFLVGVGCGASFTSCVVLLTRWYPAERVGTMYGRVFAASQLGNFAAASPLAWVSETVGWRTAFTAMAVITVVVVAAFGWLARDHPPGAALPPRRRESFAQTLRGFGEVLRQPGYLTVLGMHLFAYATTATLLGLWAGPYLHDVHGLDAVQRGHVLVAMTVAQTAGMLGLVPLERRLNTRKRVILGAASVVIVLLLALAWAERPPLALAVGLLVAICFASTYSPIIIAHAASLMPASLLGRGSATTNISQVIGSFALPVITGTIAGAFGHGDAGYPPQAYRWIFVSMAVALSSGVAIYSRARDRRPRTG